MKNSTIIINLFCCLVLAGSCRDYVEIDLVGQRELKYTDDYQNMLNNSTQVEASFYLPVLASDDIKSEDEVYLNRLYNADAGAYTWAADLVGDNNEDQDWARLYNQIYKFNLIIDEVMQSQNGTEPQKKSILAQAKVHRALNYFYLVNIYAKQYDGSTASSDLGVPLLTKPDLYARLDRQPVEVVYTQIIDDLTSSIADLPALPNFNILASKAAANAILARVYLQMRDYAEAIQFAEAALSYQNGLVNLSDYVDAPNTYPYVLSDPEEIFVKTLSNNSPTLALNPELLSLFDESDLRVKLFTASGDAFAWNSFVGTGYWKHRIMNLTSKVTNGPTVPEMMLIKAEVLARDANRFAEALPILDELRRHRFLEADFTPMQGTIQQDVLSNVFEERRRELMAKGLRWFDQKRLANEGFIGTKTRTFKGETYTLEPNSNRYVFPIASKYIVLNPEIKQNPR